RWLAPHFEKRLAENAFLAIVYARAYRLLDDPAYLEVAKRTLDFLLRDLRAPGGALYAGLAADTAGGPGAAYRWTRDQIDAALPDRADRERFRAAFALTPQSGGGALYRIAGPAASVAGTPDEASLARIREMLFAAR